MLWILPGPPTRAKFVSRGIGSLTFASAAKATELAENAEFGGTTTDWVGTTIAVGCCTAAAAARVERLAPPVPF